MSIYIVTVHYTGGSGGEAIPPVFTAAFTSENEAEKFVSWVDSTPGGSEDMYWPIIHKLESPATFETVLDKLQEEDFYLALTEDI